MFVSRARHRPFEYRELIKLGRRFRRTTIIILAAASLLFPTLQVSVMASSQVLTGNLVKMLPDPGRPRLYVLDYAGNSIVVLDTNTQREITRVWVGSGPDGLDVSADGKELYVGLAGVKALAVVDLDTLKLSRSIPLSASAFDVAAGRPGRVYVTTNEGLGYPIIVDTINNEQIGKIYDNGPIFGGALVRTSADRSTLYLGETGISPVIILKYSIVTDNPTFVSSPTYGDIGSFLQDFAVSPDGARVYVAATYPSYVQVLNSSSWANIGSLNLGNSPVSVGLAKNGGVAFAAPSSPSPYQVASYNTSTFLTMGHYAIVGDVSEVRATEDGSEVFALTHGVYGESQAVEVISTSQAASGQPSDFVVSTSSTGISIPQGSFGYVTLYINSVDGYSGEAAYSTTIIPAGANPIRIYPASDSTTLNPGGSFSPVLTIYTKTDTPPGYYAIVVSVTNGTVTRSTSFGVNVIQVGPVGQQRQTPSLPSLFPDLSLILQGLTTAAFLAGVGVYFALATVVALVVTWHERRKQLRADWFRDSK